MSNGARRGGKTTREAIFAAALALAAERGITATTMDDIAARAGVAKGSLYYNFSSKDQLFDALLESELSELSARLASAREGLRGRAAIRALVEAVLQAMQEEPDLARVLVTEIFRDDRSWVQTVAAAREGFLSAFQVSCEEAAADAGHPLRNAAIVSAGVFGSALLIGLEWLLRGAQTPRGELVEQVAGDLAAVLG